jgi:3-methylfumaryl-CoA hydratase
VSPDGVDIDHLRGWIGREDEASDVVTTRLLDSARATFDSDRNFPRRRDAVPVSIHWCLAPAIAPTSELGVDGHPRRGGFLPPVPLPRRMWASSEIRFDSPLRAGDAVTRRSRIADVSLKAGRTGPLCFVLVDHAYATAGGLAIEERQTIVYRGAEAAALARRPERSPRSPKSAHRLTLQAVELLLFRYSALTFNSHRIHYDRPYSVEQEGYSGLVVQGPLQASLLQEFAADLRDGAAPKRFSFRGLSPLTDRQPFTLYAIEQPYGLALWIEDSEGATSMQAEARW